MNLELEEAIGLVLGAVNAAGKAVNTVSHKFDYPPPTVKVISYKGGVMDVPEFDIVRWRSRAAQQDIDYRFGRLKKKKTIRSSDRRKK